MIQVDAQTAPATPAEVREWAQANGHTIGNRGRIGQPIRDAFTAATGRKVAAPVTRAAAAPAE